MKPKILALLLSLLFVFNFSSLFAQKKYAQAGVIEFGGNALYGSNKMTLKFRGEEVGKITRSEFKVEPLIGFFVINNLQLNAILSFSQETEEFKPKVGSSSKVTRSTLGLNLAPAYVFKFEEVYPYASVLFNLFRREDKNGGTRTGSLTIYGLQAGVKVKVTEGGLLNIGLLYNIGSGKLKTTETTEELDLSGFSQFQLVLGFSLYR